jgi:hypothetical protein
MYLRQELLKTFDQVIVSYADCRYYYAKYYIIKRRHLIKFHNKWIL